MFQTPKRSLRIGFKPCAGLSSMPGAKSVKSLLALGLLFSLTGISQCSDGDGDGWTAADGDCNDMDASIYPGAPEVCDGVDQDCDGTVDEGVMPIWYGDEDEDGFGLDAVTEKACDQPAGYAAETGDCDDGDATIYPGAEEVCDGLDQDCDGVADEGLVSSWYVDEDGDGFGLEDSTVVEACAAPEGYAAEVGDCDDGDPTVYPGAPELCDGLDQDCDGVADGGVLQTVYEDLDGDGFGGEPGLETCAVLEGYVSRRGDCDDGDSTIYPGADDGSGDGLDSDCGGTDELDPRVGLDPTSSLTLQAALDAAVSGQTIWVGPGNYEEYGLTMGGKAIALRSTDGRDATVIDGLGLGTVFYFNNGETQDSLLDGFTVTGGEASDNCEIGGSCREEGGGLFLDSSSPSLTNLIVSDNHASYLGGGLFLVQSDPSVTHLLISGNSASPSGFATAGGGGMAMKGSNPSMVDVVITENSSMNWGGGLYLSSSHPTLTNVSITNNRLYEDGALGGGLYLSDSNPILANVVISGNRSSNDGGGCYAVSSSPTFTQVVISGNYAQDEGGGLTLSKGAPIMTQVLIVGNASFNGGGGIYLNESSPVVTNSIISHNTGVYNVYQGGTGVPVFSHTDFYDTYGDNFYNVTVDDTNFQVDPGFQADPTWDDASGMWLIADQHLSLESPLVNAGDVGQDGSWLDVDGSAPDLGAYGGPLGDLWDVDVDGVPDYFWPGSIDDSPDGFNAADYDLDDAEASVQ